MNTILKYCLEENVENDLIGSFFHISIIKLKIREIIFTIRRRIRLKDNNNNHKGNIIYRK